MKQSNTDRLGTQEHIVHLWICGCGIGRKVLQKVITNENPYNDNIILTWFLKGSGTFSQGEKDYDLFDCCVCLRNPEVPFTMQIENDAGPRLFLSMTSELFHFINMLIPELKQMPPVWDCPFSQDTFDAFFAFYEHIQQVSSSEFYQTIPELVRYVLCVTGIQQRRDRTPLEKGRLFLEENQFLSLEEIAEKCDMNYHTFRRQFLKTYGISPGKYRIRKRIETASRMLEQGVSVGEVSELMGYPDIYTFSHQFKMVKGISPGKYCSEQMDEDNDEESY